MGFSPASNRIRFVYCDWCGSVIRNMELADRLWEWFLRWQKVKEEEFCSARCVKLQMITSMPWLKEE